MCPKPLFWTVHWYGIMIALGVAACFAVLYLYARPKKINEKFIDFVFYNGVASIVAGFGSAALFQAVYDFIANPSAGFHINGGITFIGGLLGGAGFFLIVYFLLRRRLSGRLIDVLSLIPCCILVAHGFGRVGCFCAGCCYGKPTDSFLGVQFPGLPGPVHPTQLYEAAFLFLMFGICSYLWLRRNFQYNMPLYLITYGIFRFCIEYLRDDYRGSFIGGLSPSQFWSLCMVIGGIALIFVLRPLLARRQAEQAA